MDLTRIVLGQGMVLVRRESCSPTKIMLGNNHSRPDINHHVEEPVARADRLLVIIHRVRTVDPLVLTV